MKIKRDIKIAKIVHFPINIVHFSDIFGHIPLFYSVINTETPYLDVIDSEKCKYNFSIRIYNSSKYIERACMSSSE